METKKKKRVLQVILNKIICFYHRLRDKKSLLNDKMKGIYTPKKTAFVVTLGIFVISIIMLFITPAKGIADDGTLGNTLTKAGLSYIQDKPDEIYNNYFIRTYNVDKAKQQNVENVHDIIIRLAIFIDEKLVKDNIFDIRFLAIIYVVLYLIGVNRLVKNICKGVTYFSESVVIAILSIIIFADISFITYFNSFYPEAIWLICFIFLVGAVCELQYKKESYTSLIIIVTASTVLCMTRWQCGIIGFIIAAFLLRAVFINRGLTWRLVCVFLSFLISMIGVISINTLKTDFTLTSKYHSMTKGVLFQSADPEETLKEFGINPSYSILTNTSAYNYYPLVFSDSEQLKCGFINQFDAIDIVRFYWKNPTALIRMMDLSVKETIYLRRNFSGNFEISASMPPMGQSIMWSMWSFFKVSSMPRTIGYLILLLVASLILFKWLSRQNKKGVNLDLGYVRILQPLVLMVIGIGLSQAIICIIMSGDAEFGQRAFLLGLAMDIILYLFICKLLPTMKIMEEE